MDGAEGASERDDDDVPCRVQFGARLPRDPPLVVPARAAGLSPAARETATRPAGPR